MSPNNKKTASSPPTKHGPRPSWKTNSTQKTNKSTLTVYAFQEPLGFEAVIYGKNDHDDGYTFPLKEFLDRRMTTPPPALIQADFSSYKVRRVPQSNNVEMLDSTGRFQRHLFIRYVDGGSTPDSRAEALEVLAAFFKDRNYFKYPTWTNLTPLTNFSWITI